MAVYTTIFTENDFEEEKLALFVFGAVSLLTLVLALGRALLCPKAPDVKAMLDQYGFVEGGTSRGLSDSSPVLRQTPHTVLVLDDWSPATDSEMSASTSLAPCATLHFLGSLPNRIEDRLRMRGARLIWMETP